MLESIRILTDATNTGRPWDRAHYPRLDVGNSAAVDLFCVEHMAIHSARDAGILAGIVERAPHMPENLILS